MKSESTAVKPDDILESFAFFQDWEDRYRYILELGKQLPAMDASLKNDDYLLRGCQSQVWIDSAYDGERMHFTVDSDASIVRGLLAIVLSIYNHQPPQAIIDVDIEAFFAELELLKHLSPMRGNGVQSMVHKIRSLAMAAV